MSPGRIVLPILAMAALALLAVALWGSGDDGLREGPRGPVAGAERAAVAAADGPAPPSEPRVAPAPRPPMDAEVDAEIDAEVPISAVRLDALQASVKAFYDTLPEGWQMPEKIRVDEVLPADAIDILGVPPESLLDELSHYPMNMRTGLEIVLDMKSDADSVGVAIILPSGRRYLDVLAIVPPPDAGPSRR